MKTHLLCSSLFSFLPAEVGSFQLHESGSVLRGYDDQADYLLANGTKRSSSAARNSPLRGPLKRM